MAQLIEFEGTTHEFPDDFTDVDIGKSLSKVSTPTGQANRALAGTGLSVSQPKPPLPKQLAAPAGTNVAGQPTRMNAGEHETFQKELADRNAATPRMSGMDIAQETGEQVLRSGAAPITGIPGAAREVGRWAKGGFRPPVLNTMDAVVSGTSNRGPGEIGDNPLEQAQGSLVAAGMTARGANNFQAPPSTPPTPPRPTPQRGPFGPVAAAAADFVPFLKLGEKALKFRDRVNEWRNPEPPPRLTAAPPAQTGSNNRTPLPAPPVTAAPPPVTGFRGAPPPRQQFAPPQQTGSNAPPIPPSQPQTPAPGLQWPERPPGVPPVEAGPPPLNWNKPAKPPVTPTKLPNPAGPRRGPELPTKWNTPETATEAGPPIPPEPTPQAGPPTPPAMEPQAGPPQPPKPQGGAETPPPNTITSGAGRSAYDNAPGKFATTEEVTQFAKTNGVSYEEAAKGFAQAGNKVLDRGGLFREIHDPRYGNVAGHPEIKAQFSKMYPQIQSMSQATPAQLATFLRQVILKQAMGEFAKGGVIVPAAKERVRGMAHVWGPKGRR